ncbi:MAG: peptide-methionine (S)-S-oxide reductase, partial [Cyanobacteria bacterium REEB65]|nr:peptide-methionine (S)-S-oxide reductase [Cyanobacteria bacterium REEB65]
EDLLDVFFTVHDPTTLNRQGNDIGTQYRSVVFCQSSAQQDAALAAAKTAEARWGRPVVTQFSPMWNFFAAEEFHQNYFGKNPEQPYCQAVVAPKVAKARQHFMAKLTH